MLNVQSFFFFVTYYINWLVGSFETFFSGRLLISSYVDCVAAAQRLALSLSPYWPLCFSPPLSICSLQIGMTLSSLESGLELKQ